MDFSDCAFAVIRADSHHLRDHVHKLRYRAYCVENAFENPNDHPEARERDEFDDRAVHSLLVHKPSGVPVGTVRLIIQAAHAPGSLPIQQVCGDLSAVQRLCAAGHSLGEISRFCLSREALGHVRRRKTTRESDSRRSVSEGLTATLTLISAVVGMAGAEGVTHVCAMMAPTLLRLLAGFGIHFEQLGVAREHHGVRQPVCRRLSDLLAVTHRIRPDVWRLITQNGVLFPLSTEGLAEVA